MRSFNRYLKLSIVSLAGVLLAQGQAWAGGCFSTTKDGSSLAATCVKWDQTKDVVWNYDAGPLKGPPEEDVDRGGSGGSSGCQLAKNLDVSNAEGVAMVERAFKRWTDVPGSKLNVVKGSPLLNGDDVNFSNVENVWSGGFVWPVPAESNVDASGCYDDNPSTACLNPIIFDHSGLITDAIQGECAHCSILGFAAILPQVADDSPQDTILSPVLRSSQAVVSGACLEPRVIDPVCQDCCPKGITVDNVEGTMTHELGHYLGLDHTLINKQAFVDCMSDTGCGASLLEQIPTMIGFFVPKMDFNTLHQDDKAMFAAMYPDPAAGPTCVLTGIGKRSSGEPLRGLEVVVRKISDPQNYAVGVISGAYAKRDTQGVAGASGVNGKNDENCAEADPAQCAKYEIRGLEANQNYMVTVQDFTDPTDNSNLGFVLEPLTPPLALAGVGDNPIDPTIANTSSQLFTCPPAGGPFTLDVRAQ